MNKKIVFFDIDGTLWDENNYIPPSTKEAILKLRENGHLSFINTGRARSFVRSKELLGLGFDGIVSACATRIEYHDEVVFYHRLDNELVERTLKTIRGFGFRPILEGVHHLYMDDEDFDEDFYGLKVRQEMGEDLRTIKDEWGRWEISKMSCATEECDVEGCYEAVKADFDFMIHNPQVVEMVPKGFDKGVGIKKVCEILNVPMEDTIAIGDSINDLEMLETAGFSVCMGNGAPKAKEISDYVTAPLHEDGIYKALSYLGLI